MMYRKPHDKSTHKSIKKIQTLKPEKKQQPKKFLAKPAPNMTKAPKIPVRQKNPLQANKNTNVSQKVEKLEKLVEKIQSTKANEEMQQILLKEIRGIKSQLNEIKTQIGMKGNSKIHQNYHDQDEEQTGRHQFQEEEEQNIMNFGIKNNGSELRQLPISNNRKNTQQQTTFGVNRPNIKSLHSTRTKKNKVLLDIGKIQPYMKQFKLENTQNKIPQPFYHGYHKKSSKPVIVKYCQQSKNMDFQNGMYQRLWKNIVKSKNICINKLYDLNQPLATNIMVIQQNKCGLEGIEMPPLKIAQQILKALQFFHQCGYLYRNIHPSHVMLSYENNVVLIDFKNMKRFVDMKGKHLQVKENDESDELDQFVANSRIKNAPEGRKDDLECIGYLALFMLEGKLPWNSDNMIQVRSKLMLNQIFGKYQGLLKYMIEVHKLSTQEMPNYGMLLQLLNP